MILELKDKERAEQAGENDEDKVCMNLYEKGYHTYGGVAACDGDELINTLEDCKTACLASEQCVHLDYKYAKFTISRQNNPYYCHKVNLK